MGCCGSNGVNLMAITKVERLGEMRFGEVGANGEEYQKGWRVHTDDIETPEPSILTAHDPTDTSIKIPVLGEPHSEQTFARLDRLRAKPVPEDPKIWVVTGIYTTHSGGEGSEEVSDPLHRRPEVSGSLLAAIEEMERDANGKRCRNSAGTPYEPRLTRDASRPNLIVTYNQDWSVFNLGMWNDSRDAVNASAFVVVGFHIGAKQAKLAGFKYQHKFEAGRHFARITVELHLLPYLPANYYGDIPDNKWESRRPPFVGPWELVQEDWGFDSIQSFAQEEGPPIEKLAPIYTKAQDRDGTEIIGGARPQKAVALERTGMIAEDGIPSVKHYHRYPLANFAGFDMPVTING